MVIGAVTALVVSLTKSTVRPVANVATGGLAAPVLSTVEDVASVGLVIVAIVLPVLVLVALALLIWAAVALLPTLAALAAYAGRVGIETIVFCPEDTPEVNVREIAAQGAKAVAIHYNSASAKADADETVAAVKAAAVVLP